MIPTSRNLHTDEHPFQEMRVRRVEAYLTTYFLPSLQWKRNQPMNYVIMDVLPNISISERISPPLKFDSISKIEEAQDEMK